MRKSNRRTGGKYRVVSWLYVMTLVLILAMSLSGILNQAVTAAAWEEKECNVTIIYHGNTTRATSCGETAAQLLDRLGLEVSGEDVVSHGI